MSCKGQRLCISSIGSLALTLLWLSKKCFSCKYWRNL